MSYQNKVAVVDEEEFLPEAVDIEVVVVYDGSTDERTREEAERLAAQGIKVLRQENKGLAAARNAWMSAAWAEYIFPLDADGRMRTDFARELTHVAGGRRDGE